MDISRTRSVGFRFALTTTVIILVLVGILFFTYTRSDRSQVIEGEIKAARNLVLMAESVRQNMEQKWDLGIFSPETVRQMEFKDADDRKKKLLAVVPVVAAWESAKAKAKEGGFEFRTPRENARNPKNNPDAVETEILEYFRTHPDAKEKYLVDDKINSVRYFRPVRLSKVCLNCHGDPATSFDKWRRDDGRDITGFKMDGKHVGDLHGSFEIIAPLDEADAALTSRLEGATGIVLPILGIAVFAMIFFVRRLVTAPLEKTINALTDIAEGEGDLTRRLDTSSQDEFSALASGFNKFADKINSVLITVRNAASTIVDGSREIAQGNTSLSQRTEEQASSLEETASSMEEMTGTVKQNADSAAQARQLADANRQRAANGADVVTRTVDAMSEINTSSNKIADIITTIDGIAFQTNLLALNAAVEAARAGEQGRGFAVVASEVRSLAQRSAEAAKEIKDLIEDSVGKVKAGTQLVDESGKVLEEIIEGTQKVADIISEIAAASQEQASGIDQVNNAITQMDNMTQDNAALVEEAAAASRSMEEQVGVLMEQISYFKLLDNGSLLGSAGGNGRRRTLDQAQSTRAPASRVNPSHLQKLRQHNAATNGKDESPEWEQF